MLISNTEKSEVLLLSPPPFSLTLSSFKDRGNPDTKSKPLLHPSAPLWYCHQPRRR